MKFTLRGKILKEEQKFLKAEALEQGTREKQKANERRQKNDIDWDCTMFLCLGAML